MSFASTEAGVGTQRFPSSCDARLKLCIALLGWLIVLSATRPPAALWIALCAWASLLALGVPLGRVLRPLGAGVFTALIALGLRVALTQGGPHRRPTMNRCSGIFCTPPNNNGYVRNRTDGALAFLKGTRAIGRSPP